MAEFIVTTLEGGAVTSGTNGTTGTNGKGAEIGV